MRYGCWWCQNMSPPLTVTETRNMCRTWESASCVRPFFENLICGTMWEIKNGLILFARGGAKKQ
jgi:hypothetical protein